MYTDADGDKCYDFNERVPNTCEDKPTPEPAEHKKAMSLLFTPCPHCAEMIAPHYMDENGQMVKVTQIAWRGKTITDFKAHVSQIGGVVR